VWAPFRQQRPEREQDFSTASGLPLEPAYFSGDPQAPSAGPGEFPFVRGIHPTMYRGRHWTMRQYAGFSSARQTNQRFHFLLNQGQTGLSIAFDLPTQIGYESDHPLAGPEAGMVGVAVNSLKDFETLFDGIPLAKVSTSMTINATALILFSMYLALAKRQGVAAKEIRGTIQNDILKEFIARGNYRFDVASSMRLTTDLFQFQQEHAPSFNPISVSGYHMREAGCTAVQEVAYTLADGVAYLQAAKDAGLDLAKTARRLSFFFNGHNDFFEEIAKFRAARRMWAHIVRDQFKVDDPKAQMLRFHTQTGGSTLTASQPEVNAVRVTIQAMAAVMGGTQSLHTNAMDEALGLPGEASARLALRTQQVLALESGIANVVDPLGGSPFVEALTDDLEAAAKHEMDLIQKDYSGMVGAVKAGYVQRKIHQSAVQFQKEVEQGERPIVSVNRHVLDQEDPVDVFRPESSAAEEINSSLAAVREERDSAKVQASLAQVSAVAATTTPLGPAVLEAVEAYATVGEICDALGKVFSPYQAPAVF
jgi:methylmalonyl-CoA mutase N-terminal domain/subunit